MLTIPLTSKAPAAERTHGFPTEEPALGDQVFDNHGFLSGSSLPSIWLVTRVIFYPEPLRHPIGRSIR